MVANESRKSDSSFLHIERICSAAGHKRLIVCVNSYTNSGTFEQLCLSILVPCTEAFCETAPWSVLTGTQHVHARHWPKPKRLLPCAIKYSHCQATLAEDHTPSLAQLRNRQRRMCAMRGSRNTVHARAMRGRQHSRSVRESSVPATQGPPMFWPLVARKLWYPV